MKKIILLVMSLCVSLPAFAELKKHNLEIAYEGSDYTYREPHMEYPISLKAKKHGVSVVYTRHSVLSHEVNDGDPSFASLEFRYMNGKADYDGFLQDGTPFKNENEKDWYYEVAFKMGRSYHLAEPLALWPYIGIGWRGLRNGEDGIIYYQGVPGYVYQRTSTYIYMPIGANLTYDMGPFTLTFNGQFDWLLHGTQNSHTGDLFVNTTSVRNTQDKGYGLRASVKLATDLGPVGVFVEPFWRYWKIQNSHKVWYDGVGPGGVIVPNIGYIVEPYNTTKEYGIRAGVSF